MSNSSVILGRFSKCSFYQNAHSLDSCLANGALPSNHQGIVEPRNVSKMVDTVDNNLSPQHWNAYWSPVMTLSLIPVVSNSGIKASLSIYFCRVDAWLLLALRQAADAQGLGLQLSCIPWSKFCSDRETNHKTYNPLRVMTRLQYSRYSDIRIEKCKKSCWELLRMPHIKVLQSLTGIVQKQRIPCPRCQEASVAA